ncbi:hypothetical protein HYH02_011808 [Chlamydomonas schloesseri]|uniref:Uncharacterized protein n=1 Tax=Chlamydomonas schloesseri TaxID=2026947 RepID=A0A835T825_9CHLO|nr:hypothetical protein HYH02_011808 [Chlamydomonas schloesseri]|eukprot:KAG2435514.1 hypothetical protein HYH02_011808 [Chlamydomonas schloesseri]
MKSLFRLRFVHRCRGGSGCDQAQLDRFQIQGCALESTCGSPVLVALCRQRHGPEGGISRAAERVHFSRGACFYIKAVVVPANRAVDLMHSGHLEQPPLRDANGRNVISGPDVSADGSIFATPMDQNGIAHLDNFTLVLPWNDQERPASGPTSSMHGEPLSTELCLVVQLLKRNANGKFDAYDMPHLTSRPFQVFSRGWLMAKRQQAAMIPPPLPSMLLAQHQQHHQQQQQQQGQQQHHHERSILAQHQQRQMAQAQPQYQQQQQGQGQQSHPLLNQQQHLALLQQNRSQLSCRGGHGGSHSAGGAPPSVPISSRGGAPLGEAGFAGFNAGAMPTTSVEMGLERRWSTNASASSGSAPAGSGGQRTSCSRRRSHLSKDSSHDDGGGGGGRSGIGSPLAPGLLVVGPARTSSGVPTSTATDTGTSQPSNPTPHAHMQPGGMVTTSGNHSAPPSTSGPAQRSSSKSIELAPLSLGLIGAGGGGGGAGGGSGGGGALPLSLSPTGMLGGARGGLSQAPSATLMDLHSSGLQELFEELESQQLVLAEDIMDMEGPAKRAKSALEPSDCGGPAFMSDLSSNSLMTLTGGASGASSMVVQPNSAAAAQLQQLQNQLAMDAFMMRGGGGGGGKEGAGVGAGLGLGTGGTIPFLFVGGGNGGPGRISLSGRVSGSGRASLSGRISGNGGLDALMSLLAQPGRMDEALDRMALEQQQEQQQQQQQQQQQLMRRPSQSPSAGKQQQQQELGLLGQQVVPPRRGSQPEAADEAPVTAYVKPMASEPAHSSMQTD